MDIKIQFLDNIEKEGMTDTAQKLLETVHFFRRPIKTYRQVKVTACHGHKIKVHQKMTL